jgi:hypothetical protein
LFLEAVAVMLINKKEPGGSGDSMDLTLETEDDRKPLRPCTVLLTLVTLLMTNVLCCDIKILSCWRKIAQTNVGICVGCVGNLQHASSARVLPETNETVPQSPRNTSPEAKRYQSLVRLQREAFCDFLLTKSDPGIYISSLTQSRPKK